MYRTRCFVCRACREFFSTGSLTLDAALGGGYPRGRIVEVGPPLPTAFRSHACQLSSHQAYAVLPPSWPLPCHAQVYGPEASGKTTLAMHACAEVQRLGGLVAYIDVEHAFDTDYAKASGPGTSPADKAAGRPLRLRVHAPTDLAAPVQRQCG
jgi:RecA/RadA recombinase